MPRPLRLIDALLDALAVLAPVACAGCGAPDRAVCTECRAALAPERLRIELDGLSVHAALRYGGRARSLLLAYKDGGRTDAAGPLVACLQAALAEALAELPLHFAGRLELATIPSSRPAFRARGYRPVGLLLRRAGLRSAQVLRPARAVADQAGLGEADRARNRAGALRAAASASGRAFLLVDDILTTGATLRDARRALEQAGAIVVGAVTVAYTEREHPKNRRMTEEVARSRAEVMTFTSEGATFTFQAGAGIPPS